MEESEEKRLKRLARIKQWIKDNPERRKSSVRRYYEKHKMYYQAWRDNNVEYIKEYNQQYDKPRKPPKRRVEPGPRPDNYKEILWSQQKGKCAYCLKDTPLTLEHMLPITRNGSNYFENLIMACISCNASKRDRTLEEWVRRLKQRSANQQPADSNTISTVKLGGLTIRHMRGNPAPDAAE